MTYDSAFALSAVGYKSVFDRLLQTVPRQSWQLPLLTELDVKADRFFITLFAEESGQHASSGEQATHDGDRMLLSLDRLFHLIEGSAENHRLMISLAVAIGNWVALKGGEIKELDLMSAVSPRSPMNPKRSETSRTCTMSFCAPFARRTSSSRPISIRQIPSVPGACSA